MTDAKESKSISQPDDGSQQYDSEEAVVIDSTPVEPTPKAKEKKSSSLGLWLFTLFNFLLIIAICGVAYWYYMQEQEVLSSRTNGIEDLRSELVAVERSITSQSEKLNRQLDDQAEASSQTLDNLLSQVLSNSESDKVLERQISELSGRRPSDWLLAEANYLVNMAGRKLFLENDIGTSMTLLAEADARLEDLGDPSLLPIRALIASDIQTLQQVNPVSTTSIALTISGMLPQVSKLPLENLKLPEPEQAVSNEVSNNPADWQENLKKVWRTVVGDFISIKRVDKPLEPYLAERQQWLIEQQLKHSLSLAQSAAINEQYELFQTAIQQAIALIVEHYQLEESNVVQFMSALQELESNNFEREYPDELISIDALKDSLERRMERQFNNFKSNDLDDLGDVQELEEEVEEVNNEPETQDDVL